MLDKCDKQIDSYESRVGTSLDHIAIDAEGRMSVGDLERALRLIKHAPDENAIEGIVKKLDVDSDSFVVLEDVLGLVKEEGLGKNVIHTQL
jgi:LETM1 and EF-hand domain-containing protein 1, mitochondrial